MNIYRIALCLSIILSLYINSPSFYINTQTIDASKCQLTGTGIADFDSGTTVTINLQSYDTSNAAMTTGGGIFQVDIRDYCIIKSTNSFICERLADTSDSHYNTDIFSNKKNYIQKIFTDKTNGAYEITYSLLAKGWITVRVFQLIQGGLRGDYYDNVWWQDPPKVTQIDENVNFNWGTDYIINGNLNNHISIRWSGAILCPETEEFTFTVSTDDGVRIYIRNELVLDHLTAVCNDCTFTYSMTSGEYYDVAIEYVQEDGNARALIYWQTTGMPKQIIPKENLFYYQIVPNSPYQIKVISDKGYGPNCEATGTGLIKAYVGQDATFTIQSKDVVDNNVASSTDNYVISLQGPDGTNTGDVTGTSTYDATGNTGIYNAKYQPTKPGAYKLHVTLGGLEIKNSPFDVTVHIGEPSPTNSKIVGITFPYTGTAGINTEFTIELYDILNNKYTEEPEKDPIITVVAKYQNSNSYTSPLNVPDLPNWETLIGKNFAGVVTSLSDGTYKVKLNVLKAGSFNVEVAIKGVALQNSPFSLEIQPSSLDACKCVYLNPPPSTVSCGTAVTIQYQCRDMYSNNIKTKVATLTGTSIVKITNSDNSYSETGTITDISGKDGCYEVSFTPTKAEEYITYISLDNDLIPQLTFTATAETTPLASKCQAVITNIQSKYVAGEYIKINITSYDQYDNLIYSDTTTSYAITLTGANPSSTQTFTATSQGNGVFVSEIQLTVANTYSISIQYNSAEVINSPFTNILCVANIASDKSLISTSVASAVAGTINIFKATLYDQYNNLVVVKSNEHISLDIKSSPCTLSTPSTELIGEYNLGTYLFNDVSFTKAGSYSIVLKVINNFGLRGDYYRNVDFHNKYSLIDLKYHNLGVHYSRIDDNIAFDLGHDAFFPDFQSKMISVIWNGYIKPETSAVYTISVVVDGRANVYINGQIAIAFSSISTESTSGDTVNYVNVNLDKDNYTPIKVEYIKSENAMITKIELYWESDVVSKEIIPKRVLYSALYNDLKTINISPSITHPSSLNIITSDYEKCVTGISNEFQFEIFDAYDNKQTVIDTFTATFVNKQNSALTYSGVITNVSSGTYKVAYTIPKAGEYTMTIAVTPNGSATTTSLSNFDVIVCSSSSVDPSKTVVNGNGLTTAVAGEQAMFTIELFDSNNNPITNVDNFHNIKIDIASADETVSAKVLTYDTINNKYLVKYIAYNANSQYTITITINNDNTNAITKTMTLSPNVPSNTKSTYNGSILTQYTMGNTNTISIKLRDPYDNPTKVNYGIYTSVTGAFGSAKVPYNQDVTDLSLFTGSFTINRKNSTYSGCGTATISSYILVPGIKRKVYSNYWMNGNVIKSQIDNVIDYSWGEDDVVVEGYDKLYSAVSWNFFIKASFSEAYTFVITTSNNVRMFIDDVMVIDSFDKEMMPQYQYKAELSSGSYYMIRLNLYIAESVSSIKLEIWSPSAAIQTISSSNAFYSEDLPVESKEYIVNTVATPLPITSLSEGDPSTYSQTSTTIQWEQPGDDGCSPITGYNIKKYDGSSTFTQLVLVANNVFTYSDAASITVNTQYKYKVTAVNIIGESELSNEATCSSISAPSAPGNPSIVFDNANNGAITWTKPTDTGIGDDTTIAVISYHLEYKDNSNPLVTDYEEIYTGIALTFTQSNLSYGRSYSYRVRAETTRGLGAYSSVTTATCSSVPGKPLSPPTNVPTITTKNQIGVEYSPVSTTNGAAITHYNLYIDDGSGNANFVGAAAVNNGLNTAYTFTTGITQGKKYYVKYAAVNSNGEGPHSPLSLPIIAADAPSKPENLVKVISSDVPIGSIKVKWELPTDDGGSGIIGYNLYLNSKFIDKVDNNIFTFTFGDIKSPSISCDIKVTAYNLIGESDATELLNQFATTLPGKITNIRLLSSSTTSIEIEWDAPMSNGGDTITSYDVRRDNGGLNSFEAEVNVVNAMNYAFSGLSSTVGYYNFQIRANNANGNGPWSDYKSFYAASKPGKVVNFVVKQQSTTSIVLKWEPPANDGGCAIYGYRILYHDENTIEDRILYNGENSPEILVFNFNYASHIEGSMLYHFSIYAINCAYISDKEEIAAYSASVPDAVPNVKVKEILSTTSLILEWSGNFFNGGMPITSYQIYKDSILLTTITDLSTSATIDSLVLSTTYKFEITAKNIVGEGPKSELLSLVFANAPSPPQDVSISVAINNVKLTWKAPANANGDSNIGYKVFISNNVDPAILNSYTEIYDTNKQSGIFSYVFDSSGFTLNKLYYVYIIAYNFGGQSTQVFKQFTYGSKPSAPYGLKATEIVPNSHAIISFHPPSETYNSPIIKYVLNKDGADQGTAYNGNVNVVRDEITGSNIGDTIKYKLKAVNNIGESDYSMEYSMKVASVPNAPSNLRIDERIDKRTIRFVWDVETPITNNAVTLGYVLYIKDADNNMFDIIDASVSTISNFCVVNSLVPGKTYTATVRAVNSVGESVDSNTLSYVAGVVPSKILLLESDKTRTTINSIYVKFSSPTDIGGSEIKQYNIYYDLTLSGTFTKHVLLTSNISGEQAYEFTGLTKGQKINVKIAAENAVGEGTMSDKYLFIAATNPLPPQNFKVDSISIVSSSTFALLRASNTESSNIVISWDAPTDNGGSDINKYMLYMDHMDSSNEFAFVPIDLNINPWNTNYQINALPVGVTYNMMLKASNANGDSDMLTSSFITATIPSHPYDLASASTNNGAINIKWTEPLTENGSVITSYKVYYQDVTDITQTEQSIMTNSIITTHTLSSLTVDHQYKIYVTAFNQIGESKKSNSIIVYASSAPSGLVAPTVIEASRTITTMTVQWTAPTTSTLPITGYDLLIDNADDETPTHTVYNGRYINNVLTFKIPNLISGKYYNIAFIAYNNAGASSLSPVLRALCGTIPKPPINIKTTSVSSIKISLSWTSPDDSGGLDILNYKIYIDGTESTTLSSSTITHDITGTLVTGTTYSIELTTINAIGESNKSHSLSVKAVDVPTAPTLTLASSNSDYCSVSWSEVTPPTSSTISAYVLYTDNAITSNPNPNIEIYRGIITHYTHSNLGINSIYQYALVAVNEAGNSPMSNVITCRTIPIANAPGSITLLTSSSSNIELGWTPPLIAYSEIVSYKLYMQQSGTIATGYNNNWNVVYQGIDLKYNVNSGLTAKTLYDFKVTNVDIEGRESTSSNIVSFYAAGLPSALTGVTTEHYSRTEIKVKWTLPVIGADEIEVNEYKIYIQSQSGDLFDTISVQNANGINSYIIQSTVDRTLITGETYLISMSAVNAVGEGPKSSPDQSIILQYYPSPPSEVQISSIVASGSNADVTLKWNTPEDNGGVTITGYSISSTDKTAATAQSEVYAGSNEPKTTTTLNSLTIGHEYEFVIYSYNPLKSLTHSTPLKVIVGLPPDKITAVTIGDRSHSSIEISWAPPNDNGNPISQYNVYNMNNDQKIAIYSGSLSSFTYDGLNQGDIIKVCVTAVNAIGESDMSDIFKFNVYGLPKPPISIAVKSFSKSKIEITWSPSVDNGGDLITHYNIYREIANDPNNIKTQLATVLSSVTEYADSTVVAGVSYMYTLTSKNTLGEGEYSTSITARALSPPTGMDTITPNIFDISSTSLQITWNIIPDNGGSNQITYTLYYKTNLSNDDFKVVYEGFNTSFKLTSLSPGTYYIFRVIASNEIGKDSSKETTAHLCGSSPNAPTNLRMVYRKDTAMSGGGVSSIMIKWDAPSNENNIPLNGYNVYMSTDGTTFNDQTGAFSKHNPTITSYTLNSGVTCGTNYYFVVTAVNAIGESVYSNKLIVLAGEIPIKPDKPLALTASAISKSVKIEVPSYTTPNSISGSTAITRYIIKMDNGKSGQINNVINDSINTIINVDGLELGLTYRFKYAISNLVYDWNNINNEELVYSDEYSITIASAPRQVKNLKIATKDYTDKLLVEWDKLTEEADEWTGAPVMSYIVTQVEEATSTSVTYTTSSMSSSYFVTGLTPGKEYTFTVKAKNIIGEGVESNSVTTTLGAAPAQMQRPTITSSTTSSVTLSWLKPTGVETGGTVADPLTISYFTLYANKNIIYATTDDSELTHTVSNLIQGESYNFQITATNSIGESPLSIMTTFIPSTYPSAPVNLKAEYQSHSSVLLKWEHPLSNGGLPVYEYELLITKTEDSSQLTFSHIADDTFAFTIGKGMVSGKAYKVKIRAHNSYSENNSFNNPNWSSEFIFYSSDLPKRIDNLNIRNVDKYTAEIYWSKLTTDTEKGYSTINVLYSLEMAKGNEHEFTQIFEGDSDKYVFTIPDRAITYYFRLRTKNNIGYSGYSNTLVTYAAYNIVNSE